MVKNFLAAILCIAFLLVMAGGCQSEEESGESEILENGEEYNMEDDNGYEEYGENDDKDGNEVTSDLDEAAEEEVKTLWREVDTQDIKELIANSIESLFKLMEIEVTGASFEIDNRKYYYLPETYDTKAKIEKYLSNYLTESGIENTLDFLPIVEEGGRMAREDLPSEPLPDIMAAEVELEEDTDISATYLLTIPVNSNSAYLGVTVVTKGEKLLVNSIDFRKGPEPTSSPDC